MIFDRLERMALYAGLNDRLGAAVHSIGASDFSKLEVGRHEMVEGAYALVKEVVATAVPDHWEAHARHADVHIVLEGSESIGYAPAGCTAQASRPYDPVEDIILYDGVQSNKVYLEPGDIAIFLPNEMHLPGCPGEKGKICKKIVLKIRFDENAPKGDLNHVQE